ncbi:MAG: hypothetical protein ACI3XR_08975 [Eubacteriales bacterium]
MKKQKKALPILSGFFKPETSFGLDCLKVLIYDILWFLPYSMGDRFRKWSSLPASVIIWISCLILLVLLPFLHTRWTSHLAVGLGMGLTVGYIGEITCGERFCAGFHIIGFLFLGLFSFIIQCFPLLIAFLCRRLHARRTAQKESP